MHGFEPAGADRLFERWAEIAPERDALVHPGGRMTYARLREHAAVLAGEPVADGARAPMEGSFLPPAAVLAIWKTVSRRNLLDGSRSLGERRWKGRES